MKTFSVLAAAAALVGSVVGAPLSRRQDIDVDILQFALTLEHLENTFYKQALSMFTEQDFINAGMTPTFFSNLKYIAHDEESHVEALSAALTAAGAMPVAACSYDFGFSTVSGFLATSALLEGVGTSAYLGGAPLITSKDYLAVAGSILVTEALHTSMQRAAVGEVPAANPYGTALTPNPVYTLAASFITSCPSSNMALPFMAFPSLTAVQGTPTSPGLEFEFSMMSAPPANSFVTFVSGLNVVSMPMSSVSGNTFMAMVPSMAEGQTYALLTNANITALADSAIIAGPAVLEVTPPSPTYDTSIL